MDSLRRLSELMPGAPLVYLLDNTSDASTDQPLSEIVSDANLDAIKSFVWVVAPWKGLLYSDESVGGAQDGQKQKLASTGLTARLKGKGFSVHTYTLRDEAQFVPAACQGDITCEFDFLFKHEGVDGAFADYPATLVKWVQENY